MCKHGLLDGSCFICSPPLKPLKPVKAPKVKLPRVIVPKVKVMTKRQFDAMCKGVRKDFHGDEVGCTFQEAAFDIADSLLWDRDIMDYMKRQYPDSPRYLLQEILADSIYG